MPTRLALLDPATFFRRLGDHENLELVAIVRCSSHEGDRISPSLIARFRNPGVPPAWVSFGARHNAIRASPPRTESRQGASPDRSTLNQRLARRKTVPAAAVVVETKQDHRAFIR